MDYIKFAITNPVKVAVGVLLVLLFGLLAVFTIPIQLTPNIDKPVITVTTDWTGRSPQEVEREIIEEQEDKLKGVSNLDQMTAVARQGQSEITLEFFVGSDLRRALQEVSDSLREVPEYPDEVDQPVITTADVAAENPIAWSILRASDPNFPIDSFKKIAEDRIKPYLERVEGLAEVRVYGGREPEVHIQVDPKRMAERSITFNQLRRALQMENVNVSAGNLKEGRLDVSVRTVGEYSDLDNIRRTIVAYTAGGPVRVQDIADVRLTLEKKRSFVRSKGQHGLAMPAYRESGSNVVQVMSGLRQRIKEVNEEMLPVVAPPGVKLELVQVYDETIYIYDALNLVLNNLWLGGAMAAVILLMFLGGGRRPLVTATLIACIVALIALLMLLEKATVLWVVLLGLLALCALVAVLVSRATGIIALAIPISVVGTFVAMTAFGRNLNVISLAGLSFAVGMVVDNAIVVLENIDRHIKMGKPAAKAAYDATREVWGAILASTLTTLAVFVPVLFIEEEAGQLFRDIALAICAAVTLSLIVAVTVIPTAAARWLKSIHADDKAEEAQIKKDIAEHHVRPMKLLSFGVHRFFGWLNTGYTRALYWALNPSVGRVLLRVSIVAFFTLVAVGGAWLLMPPTDYLPKGNRNLVFGIIFTPPGYNIDQDFTLAQRVESHLSPYWRAYDEADKSREDWLEQAYARTAELPPAMDFRAGVTYPRTPPIENFFFVSFGGRVFAGAASADKQVVEPLGALLTQHMNALPGSFGFAQQVSLFGRGIGGANAVEVEIKGTDLRGVRTAAEALFMRLMRDPRFSQIQPDPANFNLAAPELQVQIDRVRAADLGVDVAALGLGVQALIDGAYIGDYRDAGDTIDVRVVRDPAMRLTPDQIAQVPLAYSNPDGTTGQVPLSSIATINWTDAPQTIKRIEELRAVTLTVVAPPGMPLEQLSNELQSIVDELRSGGAIARGVEVDMAGTASDLVKVREAMLGSWHGWTLQSLQSLISSRMFLALLITYLLMAALFESWVYPFVIMFSVPLATVGGFLGLRITHEFVPTQLLDVLTMLGFVILIGIVVNNAILIVHQALNFMKGFGESEEDKVERMPPRRAITESVRTRMRPILMTTLTSVFGMLPLVLQPGSGSELYRGLGSVVLGGLVISTAFTLLLVPMLFSLVVDAKLWFFRRMNMQAPELVPQGI